MKLKAISGDHCSIAYNQEKGWTITERGKSKVSSNGTYMFMKSAEQIDNRIPSDLIPLYDGQLISFVNYELQVSFEERTQHEVNAISKKMKEFFDERKPEMLGYQGEEVMVNPEVEKAKDAAKNEADDNAANKAGTDKRENDKGKDEKKKKNLTTTIDKSAPISGTGPEIASAPEQSKKVELT